MFASLNYNEKLDNVKKMLSCWKYRRLTLLGKITVLKSLVVSQLVHLLTPLKSNYSALTEINKLLYTFLWNGKGDKIKRNVIINDYCDGGLKMIDIFSFNKSLKVTWIPTQQQQREMEIVSGYGPSNSRWQKYFVFQPQR